VFTGGFGSGIGGGEANNAIDTATAYCQKTSLPTTADLDSKLNTDDANSDGKSRDFVVGDDNVIPSPRESFLNTICRLFAPSFGEWIIFDKTAGNSFIPDFVRSSTLTVFVVANALVCNNCD